MIQRTIETILLKIPILKERSELKHHLLENAVLKKENQELKNKFFHSNFYRFEYIAQKLRKKVARGQKIKVYFFIMFDAAFSARPLYEAMLAEKMFEPHLVVIPDISRGKKHKERNLRQAYAALSKKYHAVQKSLDTQDPDVIFFPNAYQGMTDSIFEVDFYLDKDVLPAYTHYSFPVTTFSRKTIANNLYDSFWKVFLPTQEHWQEFQEHSLLKGVNASVTGYSKMDDLAKQTIKERERKVIIIAPHHTVTDWKLLHISNFLTYADFFLNLPRLYPQIDFVFRPHPLLITQLRRKDVWGEEKTEVYFKKITELKNMRFDQSGEYLDLFANSDGIIHDCGSFLAEYLFTDKPACYMLENEAAIKKWFLPIGQQCLEYCYKAYSEKNILSFLDQVVLKNRDTLKSKRINFAKKNLKINYPFATKKILSELKNTLT